MLHIYCGSPICYTKNQAYAHPVWLTQLSMAYGMSLVLYAEHRQVWNIIWMFSTNIDKQHSQRVFNVTGKTSKVFWCAKCTRHPWFAKKNRADQSIHSLLATILKCTRKSFILFPCVWLHLIWKTLLKLEYQESHNICLFPLCIILLHSDFMDYFDVITVALKLVTIFQLIQTSLVSCVVHCICYVWHLGCLVLIMMQRLHSSVKGMCSGADA